MDILLLISGLVGGFMLARLSGGKTEGQTGRIPSCKIKLRKYIIHLHHWTFSTTILIILIMSNFFNELVYGLLIGHAFQGFTYRDFHKIIFKK